jgi:hypothetical protein
VYAASFAKRSDRGFGLAHQAVLIDSFQMGLLDERPICICGRLPDKSIRRRGSGEHPVSRRIALTITGIERPSAARDPFCLSRRWSSQQAPA